MPGKGWQAKLHTVHQTKCVPKCVAILLVELILCKYIAYFEARVPLEEAAPARSRSTTA